MLSDEQDENEEEGQNFGTSLEIVGRGRESYETAQDEDDDQTMNTDGISFSKLNLWKKNEGGIGFE